MNKLNPAAFAAWLLSLLSTVNGYLMGAVGQKAKDLSLGSWLITQYKAITSQYTKAKYWLANAVQVFDCQGLADCYVTDQTGTKTNVYARNNYSNWCTIRGTGKIPARYRVPGAAVFYHDGTRISHVGFLVKPVVASDPDGDWYVVEARGVMYGVVRTKLLSRSWNRWGLMDTLFDYSAVLLQYHGTVAELPTDEITLGSRLLKLGAKGTDVSALQNILVSLGYDIGNFGDKRDGVDGDFGELTEKAVKAFQATSYDLEVDGEYGELTHAALMTALAEKETDNDEPETEPTKTITVTGGSVYVRSGPGTTYDIVTVVRKGDKLPWLATADNGWHSTTANGKTGWITGKYTTIE